MSDIINHFHNQKGVPSIAIPYRKFMCIGALPPLDHPHIFIDMGSEAAVVCPYCSTVYRFDAGVDKDLLAHEHQFFSEELAPRSG